MLLTWGETKVGIIKGDITEQDVDAIVNAANSSLMGGGGVDGAIHRKGGPRILAECKIIRQKYWPDRLPSGKAVITNGGLLKARHVIHTVGPIWKGGDSDEAKTLAECYQSSLDLTKKMNLRSIAFPAISTGAYGYPVRTASRIALETVKRFVEEEGWPSEVDFVLFNDNALRIYEETANELD